MPVGLHFIFRTLTCKSPQQFFPHVNLIFQPRTELPTKNRLYLYYYKASKSHYNVIYLKKKWQSISHYSVQNQPSFYK